ncbi:MAG: methyltransferase domain-containing protein [Candidatus Spechtbacteria bacterium]|nr:methyltransferase domain-containing protein [Candidatus Spechtbacteria bacterium]
MNIKPETIQAVSWAGKMGKKYTDRNPQSTKELNELYRKQYGISRVKLNRDFLGALDRNFKILEVGANIGLQLETLRKMGFSNLLGVEINEYAVRQAKEIHPKVDIIRGSALNLPFREGYFDLVFTSGVLIHISPKDINKALDEIWRTSSRYVWGFEYFAPELSEITYRGKKDLLWKRDFCALYLQRFPDFKIVKEQKFSLKGSENQSQMFLLKKV